jgi:hypothetical protein
VPSSLRWRGLRSNGHQPAPENEPAVTEETGTREG